MRASEQNWVRLPLENAHNVRELGGVPLSGGGQTAWKRFLRADDMDRLSQKDIDFLLEYGVCTVIDLRSASEVKEKPDKLAGRPEIRYYHIPLMEQDLSPEGQLQLAKSWELSDMYLELVKRKAAVAQIFEAIGGEEDGCVLFHCAGGKDRTGLLGMLLMMLAGADYQDCQTSYMQSCIHLSRNAAFGADSPLAQEFAHLLNSNAENIAPSYRYVQSCKNGIEGYLEACGVQAATIARIKDRMLAAC